MDPSPTTLVQSLVTAILRADGDALVMHVGERPYVASAFGPVKLSTQPLTAPAMVGMLAHLLPRELQRVFDESDAVEHELAPPLDVHGDRFTVAASRSGGDLWIDICRHRRPKIATFAAMPTGSVAPLGGAAPRGGVGVGPMTRTVRIEVPPPVAARDAFPSEIEHLLALAMTRQATALYLTTDASPFIRVDGDVRSLEGVAPLSASHVEAALLEVAPEPVRDAVRRGNAVEWMAEFPDVGRVKCAAFRDYRGLGAILQLVVVRPRSAEQIALTAAIEALATETDGVVLVASPRHQGKTTLLGALVDLINRTHPRYVISFERRIRIVHDQRAALISQREMHGTIDQALAVVHSALAENPDVLVIGEVESAGMFQLALDAAGSGALVFVEVNAASATGALERVIQLFSDEERPAVRTALAERLRGVVAQALVRKTGGGRIAARELVLPTRAVVTAIADGRLDDLPLAIERGPTSGMRSLNRSLMELVQSGAVDLREAYRKAVDRDGLRLALEGEGMDVSALEA